MQDKYKDFGYANGWWDGTPDEVQKCRDEGHQKESKTVGRCVTEYTCDICKIKYMVDSSD